MKLSQLEPRKAQHVVVFGDPGTGKSTLASKLAEEGYNILWVSIDNGHTVLYKLSVAARENIEIIVLPDTKEFPIAIATCLKIISGAEIRICNQHGQVNCSTCVARKLEGEEYWTTICLGKLGLDTVVVFDNIGQLADSAMNFIIKEICKEGPNKGKEDTYRPGYDEFRLQGSLMNKFLINVQQCSNHICCIAHVCETEMEDGSKKLVPLIGTVPFSRNSGRYFDHMVYCNVLNKTHRFGSSTTYLAGVVSKSRTDVAIENLDNKSLAPFFKGEIKGAEQNGSDAAQKVITSISAAGSGVSAVKLPMSAAERLQQLRSKGS
jgi:hypothetical protein